MISSLLNQASRHGNLTRLTAKHYYHGAFGAFGPHCLILTAKPILFQPLNGKPTTFAKPSPCQQLRIVPQVRLFHSTTPSLKWQENPYENQIMNLMKKKPVDFQRIEDQLASIQRETKTVMNIHMFVKMVKACTQMKSFQAAEAAERFVFYWMLKFHEENRLGKPQLGNIFGMALQAWVSSKHPSSGKRAELLLDKMEDMAKEGSLPFPIENPIHCTVMKAYAVHGDVENTQVVFDRCMNAFQQGNENTRPNVVLWNTLLDASSKSKNPDAWKVAENHFAAMQKSHKEGILKNPPDSFTYSSIINVCAKSKQPARAEFWLQEMYKDYKNGNTAARPNVHSFGTVIDAWARSGTPDAWKAAGELLGEMQRSHKEGILVDPPNAIIYSSIINACSKSKQPQMAEFWLREMHKDYENGNTAAHPNLHSFGTVIDAWARSGDSDAWKKAEEVLGEMQRSHKEGILKDPPNAFTYSSIINACAKSKQPLRAEFWLREMYKDYKNGNASAQPDEWSFSAVIDAWANSETEEGAERCEKILNDMIIYSKETELPVKPNTVSYNTVMIAYARVRLPRKAEAVLQRQYDNFKAGNKRAALNVHGFNAIIHGWAKAKERISGERAELVLNRMAELHKQGILKERPDVYIYTAVINTWAVLEKPDKAREVFDRMLNDYKSGNRDAKPSLASFCALLQAYSNAKLPNAGELADDLLEEMKSFQLAPDKSTYVSVFRCWECSAGHIPRAEARARELSAKINKMK